LLRCRSMLSSGVLPLSDVGFLPAAPVQVVLYFRLLGFLQILFLFASCLLRTSFSRCFSPKGQALFPPPLPMASIPGKGQLQGAPIQVKSMAPLFPYDQAPPRFTRTFSFDVLLNFPPLSPKVRQASFARHPFSELARRRGSHEVSCAFAPSLSFFFSV